MQCGPTLCRQEQTLVFKAFAGFGLRRYGSLLASLPQFGESLLICGCLIRFFCKTFHLHGFPSLLESPNNLEPRSVAVWVLNNYGHLVEMFPDQARACVEAGMKRLSLPMSSTRCRSVNRRLPQEVLHLLRSHFQTCLRGQTVVQIRSFSFSCDVASSVRQETFSPATGRRSHIGCWERSLSWFLGSNVNRL